MSSPQEVSNVKQESQEDMSMKGQLSVLVNNEEFKNLFEHLRSNGVPLQKATDMIQALAAQNEVYMENSESLTIQTVIPLDKLEEYCGWSGLTVEQKYKVLYNLGMDTNKKGFYTEKRRILEGTTQVIKDVVYGEERTDKVWVESAYSSQAVKDYVWNLKQG